MPGLRNPSDWPVLQGARYNAVRCTAHPASKKRMRRYPENPDQPLFKAWIARQFFPFALFEMRLDFIPDFD